MSAITTEELRVKADELGIRYTSKTSDDTLLAKIEKAEKEREAKNKQVAEKKVAINRRLKRRVEVRPLNPNELHMKAKFFCLMNSVDTEKVAVPFGTPWFLSDQMIEHIKSQKYLYIPSNVTQSGKVEPVTKQLKEAYAVTELPPLTKEEFDNLKKDKMLRDSANEGK